MPAHASCHVCISVKILSHDGSAAQLGCRADHLKLMFPFFWAVTQLAWAMLDGKDILQSGKFGGGPQSNWDWALQTLLFGVEFLLRCHSKDDALVIQVRS